MNIFKLFTRSGRQDIVREMVKPYVTVDAIANYATDGVAKVLAAGAEKLTDERCAQIAEGCRLGGNALIYLTGAVSPDGDGGKIVTDAEKVEIRTCLAGAVRSLVTQEGLDEILEKVIEKVP